MSGSTRSLCTVDDIRAEERLVSKCFIHLKCCYFHSLKSRKDYFLSASSISRITRVIAFLEDRESHAIIRSGALRIGVALILVTDSSDNE